MNLQEIDFGDKDLTERVYDIPTDKKKKKGKKNGKNKITLWDKIFSKNLIKKPNVVAVLYLRNNGRAEPMELESKKGFFSIYGQTYHEHKDCIYAMGRDRVPLAIIPEWSPIPFGKKEWHDKAMLEKFHDLTDPSLKAIRNAELVRSGGEKNPIKLNAKAVIGIGLAVIVGVVVWQNFI